jgi:hypothetical protein
MTMRKMTDAEYLTNIDSRTAGRTREPTDAELIDDIGRARDFCAYLLRQGGADSRAHLFRTINIERVR